MEKTFDNTDITQRKKILNILFPAQKKFRFELRIYNKQHIKIL